MNKMGKEYKCKDAGIDCEAVLYGETEIGFATDGCRMPSGHWYQLHRQQRCW